MHESAGRVIPLSLFRNNRRSRYWQAECLSLAAMKVDGESAKKLGKVFGMSANSINVRAAIGAILRRSSVTLKSDAELKDFEKYILPLRIQTQPTINAPKGKKDFQTADYNSYDYSECIEALRRLASGELSRAAAPRAAIGEILRRSNIDGSVGIKIDDVKASVDGFVDATVDVNINVELTIQFDIAPAPRA